MLEYPKRMRVGAIGHVQTVGQQGPSVLQSQVGNSVGWESETSNTPLAPTDVPDR